MEYLKKIADKNGYDYLSENSHIVLQKVEGRIYKYLGTCFIVIGIACFIYFILSFSLTIDLFVFNQLFFSTVRFLGIGLPILGLVLLSSYKKYKLDFDSKLGLIEYSLYNGNRRLKGSFNVTEIHGIEFSSGKKEVHLIITLDDSFVPLLSIPPEFDNDQFKFGILNEIKTFANNT